MATFLANEINFAGGDITGRTAHVQIMFPLKGKKCKIFEDIFRGRRWINNRRKSNSVWSDLGVWRAELKNNQAYLLRTEITKRHLTDHIC